MASVRGPNEIQDAVAIVDEQRRQGARQSFAPKSFTDDMQSSLIYSLNWNDLFSAAPIAVNLMAACYVASASRGAASMVLTPPKDGFQYVKYEPRLYLP
jgi:hypothetical protein